MHLENTVVRFRNNKPFLFKKILITLLFIGFFAWMIFSFDWLTLTILLLFIGLPIVFKIRKQPSEGKGFFGKVSNFYKNMYKDYVIATIPMDFDCNDEKITITLHRAEMVGRKPALETFDIAKDKIAGILLDDTDRDILIMFQEAKVVVFDENTKKELRDVTQQDSTICFSVKSNEDIISALTENGYELELLSEIQNEPEETEDPELVAKSENNESETEDSEAITSEKDTTNTNDIENIEDNENIEDTENDKN